MANNNEGLRRFSGQYGKAIRDGVVLSEAVEVSGAIDLNRIEVPLVGQNKMGYKAGRETREGTIRIQKIDSAWETEMWEYLDLRRRYLNGTTAERPVLRTFNLKVEIKDPEAFQDEVWQLSGCQIWRLPLGFSITDDLLERELPMTWDSEDPLSAFTLSAAGAPVTYQRPA
jgi:Phage tail tube protein